MTSPNVTTVPSALHIGCAPQMHATQKVIGFNPYDVELRIEALIPPDSRLLVITRERAHADEIERRVSATSAGISASGSPKDHSTARREIDRATDADWSTLSIIINEQTYPVRVFQLISGGWAGYVEYRGSGISLGSRNIDLEDVRLMTLDPADVAH